MTVNDEVRQVERAMVRVRRRQTRRALSPGGLPDRLAGVLDAVEPDHPHGTTVGTLAHRLGVDQPRASKLVAEAVAADLLTRSADQRDGRRSPLVLTEEGLAALRAVRDHRAARFAGAMHDWPAEDQRTFARLLTRFVDALDAADADRP
ncbi:MarR family winged helix-turn-helix transcriptional regulator [Nonomuraea sp. NPDC055795]